MNVWTLSSSCWEKHHKCIISKADTEKQLSAMLCNKDSKIQITTEKEFNPQSFLYTYLDLVGAEMTASTAVGSKAIAAKVDPTSFKSLYSLYFN